MASLIAYCTKSPNSGPIVEEKIVMSLEESELNLFEKIILACMYIFKYWFMCYFRLIKNIWQTEILPEKNILLDNIYPTNQITNLLTNQSTN